MAGFHFEPKFQMMAFKKHVLPVSGNKTGRLQLSQGKYGIASNMTVEISQEHLIEKALMHLYMVNDFHIVLVYSLVAYVCLQYIG